MPAGTAPSVYILNWLAGYGKYNAIQTPLATVMTPSRRPLLQSCVSGITSLNQTKTAEQMASSMNPGSVSSRGLQAYVTSVTQACDHLMRPHSSSLVTVPYGL
jgi:hypothetical protein